MSSKIKVLWVEDETLTGMVEKRVYLDSLDNLDITVAPNASEAEMKIFADEIFDVYLLDIRIPPGFDEKWVNDYQESMNKGTKKIDRLGIKLFNLLLHDKNIPINKIGFLTIERWEDIRSDILSIINNFNVKSNNKIEFNLEKQYLHKIVAELPEDLENFIIQLCSISIQ